MFSDDNVFVVVIYKNRFALGVGAYLQHWDIQSQDILLFLLMPKRI